MKFRVLSYNIHRAIGVDRRFAPQRVAEILRAHDADIVLLQEVDRHALRSNRMDLASHLAGELSYQYRGVGMNVFLKSGRYGNATLSRFPIGRQRNIDLSQRRMIRRGAQHTRVHMGRHDVDIFNIHLGLLARERNRQMALLMSSHDLTHVPAGGACIIGGDTNDWRGLLCDRWLRPGGFDCATNHASRPRRSIKTFPSYAPAGGLDKLFYRGLRLLGARRSELKLARVASDHLPIIADFALDGG